MSVENFPSKKPAAEQPAPSAETVREKMREAHIQVLTSEGPVHGSALGVLEEQERKNIAALLSSLGSSPDDIVLKDLPAESIRNMIEYAKMPARSPEREVLSAQIREDVQRAQNEYYNPEYKQAA